MFFIVPQKDESFKRIFSPFFRPPECLSPSFPAAPKQLKEPHRLPEDDISRGVLAAGSEVNGKTEKDDFKKQVMLYSGHHNRHDTKAN